MDNEDDELNDLSDFSDTDEEVQEEPEVIETETKQLTPEYSNADLDTLINYIKKMTILQGLEDDDWDSECDAVMKQWIMDVNLTMIFVFYDKEKLTVSLTFPTVPVYDVMYFLRDSQHIFTLDDFHDEVTFGRIQDDVDGTLLNLIEKIFAPAFFGKNDWIENVYEDFSKALHFFLVNVTALHFKMSGLAVLYIPSEALTTDVTDAVNDVQLLKRLDMIAEHWVSTLRMGLSDTEQITPYALITPIEEYDFWIYRSEVIYGIQHQTCQKDFLHIMQILDKGQSTFVNQINKLIEEANQEFIRINDNILYLRLLLKPCEEINGLESPSEVAVKLPKIINIIRFIWLNSKYYNTKEFATKLFRYLSNQIITFCQKKIDVERLLNDHPDEGIKIANLSIDCCLYYKVIYDCISDEHKSSKAGWELDNSKIFNHVDTFIRRLYDFIEIAEGIIVFGGDHESRKTITLLFGGDNAKDFEITRMEFERQFKNGLCKILEVSEHILNVNSTEWENQFKSFRTLIEDLEGIVHNLMTNVFLEIKNVEEGIGALSCFHIYSRREHIRSYYIRKVSDVWKMFAEEIATTNDQLIFKTSGRLAKLPKNAARAISIKINRDRIVWLHSLFKKSEWLPENPHSYKILNDYIQLTTAMTQNIQKIYDEWLHSLGIEVSLKLNRSLMTRSVSHPGLFECNIDHTVFNIFEEAYYFKLLGFGFPVHINQFLTKRNAIKTVYDSVLKVIRSYNKILMSLSDTERLLFRPLIGICDHAILPGVFKLTWASESIDPFLADSNKHIRDLQDFLEIYRKVNLNVVEACEKISCITILCISIDQTGDWENIKQNVMSYRNEKMLELIKHYNYICEMLLLVYDALEVHLDEVLEEWTAYIEKMDKLLEKSLILLAIDSLKLIYTALHGNGSVGPRPFINVVLDLSDNKLNITPSMQSITDFFGNIHRILLDSISYLPRLLQKFELNVPSNMLEIYKVIENNVEFREIQKSIVHEVMLNQREMMTCIEEWTPFASLWQLDKTIFVENFKKENAAALIFNKNVERLTDITNQIMFREIKSTVYFMIVYSKKLKQILLEQVELWKIRYLDLLEESALEQITDFFNVLQAKQDVVAKVPENVAEMHECFAIYDGVNNEMGNLQNRMQEIKDFFEVLAKHNVRIDGELSDMRDSLDDRWTEYLQKLADAKEMLNNAKDSFILSV